MLRRELYPDSTGPTDSVTYSYNRQSQRTSLTDQNGSTRQFDYDALGRQTQDRVTTLGPGVDGAVRRVAWTYDVRGQVSEITCYNNATVGSGTVVNQISRSFDDFAGVTHTYQAHSGTVNTSTTPWVGQTFTDGSGNVLRKTKVTYPSGREISYGYGSSGSIDDEMNRVSSLTDDDSTVLAEYEYLGNASVVQQDSTEADLRYTLIDPSLTNDPDTGDIYAGLDRFGRVKDVRWRDVSAGTDLARIEYGYDRAGNRTWRENPSDPNREHDWLYHYDGLHRLKDGQRGELNSGHTAITGSQGQQCWTLDSVGNWSQFRDDTDGNGTWDLVQDRTANKVNEITDIDNTVGTAWATPAYDKNGNTTTSPRPDLGSGSSMTATWDAWNRLVKLVDAGTSDTLLENEYDGRNFRIVAKEYSGGTLDQTRHYYFTDEWQSVEERVDSATTPERQHVWGIRYIDDLVVRDRATSGGALNERLYHCADANWNTVAVVDDSGVVAERYEYTPYGELTFFAADYTPRTTSSYDTRYTYTNREWTPEVHWYYFRNRWYDPVLGRFCSRDPIQFKGSRWNLHQYVSSNPVLSLDPSGLRQPPVYPGGPWPIGTTEPSDSPGYVPTSTNSTMPEVVGPMVGPIEPAPSLHGMGCGLADCVAGCGGTVGCAVRCETARLRFHRWYHRNRDLEWTRRLPTCPRKIDIEDRLCIGLTGHATIHLRPQNPDPNVWNDPTDQLHGYHVGAKFCMRSLPVNGHASQCCYNFEGRLITSGAGSGSADYVPGTVLTFLGH